MEDSQRRAKEFYYLMNQRRSLRYFSSEPVPRELVETLVRTAGEFQHQGRRLPSPCVEEMTDVLRFFFRNYFQSFISSLVAFLLQTSLLALIFTFSICYMQSFLIFHLDWNNFSVDHSSLPHLCFSWCPRNSRWAADWVTETESLNTLHFL